MINHLEDTEYDVYCPLTLGPCNIRS